MKITIITPVLNEKDTISSTIECVLNQTYKDIEYIVVDNGSTDGTLEIIDTYGDKISKILFEDKRGIYTTMNRGLREASGDIVGILNANDIYNNDYVISDIVDCFSRNDIDVCWGDLLYVEGKNTDKVVRYWKSSEYKHGLFRKGWVPPHPTFFVKKEIYEKFGYFNLNYKLAADFEIMLRFLKKKSIKSSYIPKVLVRMRLGGATNAKMINILKQNFEIWRSLYKHKLGIMPIFAFYKMVDRVKQYNNAKIDVKLR